MEVIKLQEPMPCIKCGRVIPVGEEAYVKTLIIGFLQYDLHELLRDGQRYTAAVCVQCYDAAVKAEQE